jgi:hypothetical protein
MLMSKLCSPSQLIFHHLRDDQLASLHLSFFYLAMSEKFNTVRQVDQFFQGLAIEALIKAASPQTNAAQFSKDACAHSYLGNGVPLNAGVPTISCPHGLPEAQLKLLGLASVSKEYATEFGSQTAKLRAIDVDAMNTQYATSLGYGE